jgi:hypothetical protein
MWSSTLTVTSVSTQPEPEMMALRASPLSSAVPEKLRQPPTKFACSVALFVLLSLGAGRQDWNLRFASGGHQSTGAKSP